MSETKEWRVCGQDRETGLCSCLQIWDTEADICIAFVMSEENCDKHFAGEVSSKEEAQKLARLICKAPVQQRTIDKLQKKIDKLELDIACLGQSPQAILWDMINMGRKWGKAEEHIKYYKKQLAEAVKLLQQPKTKEGESYIVILMDWLNDVDDFLESLEKESE